MLIGFFLYGYLSLLTFIFFLTVLLILCDLTWGQLPHLYLQLIEKIQSQFQEAYPDRYFERLPWKDIITDRKSISKGNDLRPNDFEMVELHSEFSFATTLNLVRFGVEAIVQDDFYDAFELAPDCQQYELSWDLWRFLKHKLHLRLLLLLLVALRLFFLFPLRVALYITSFVFLGFCCVLSHFVELSVEHKVFISRRYCRLYTAAIGLVAYFYNEQDRPRPPGVAVANHFSANDIMVICSNINTDHDYMYTVTGQRHGAIIGFIQNLVTNLCSVMWLERSIADSRLKFLKNVLSAARQNHLILMFPEGYCSNGNKVLQFRKAVFEKNIRIYPVAIRQDSRFGDVFWKESFFVLYLLRLWSNFASVYHIHYLPVQQRMEDETPEEFAQRVQDMIAKRSNARSLQFQGTLFYKTTDREKYKQHLKKMCAKELYRLTTEPPLLSMSASASDGP